MNRPHEGVFRIATIVSELSAFHFEFSQNSIRAKFPDRWFGGLRQRKSLTFGLLQFWCTFLKSGCASKAMRRVWETDKFSQNYFKHLESRKRRKIAVKIKNWKCLNCTRENTRREDKCEVCGIANRNYNQKVWYCTNPRCSSTGKIDMPSKVANLSEVLINRKFIIIVWIRFLLSPS